MGIIDRTFGETGKARRQAKREERAQIRYELYRYRPTIEERLQYAFPTMEASRSGLGIYGTESEIAIHPHQMAKAALAANGLLRVARLVSPMGYQGDLRNLIDMGEKHLKSIAAFTGSSVVNHTFVLHDIRDQMRPPRHHQPTGLIPHGYEFAAHVDAIHDIQPLTDAQTAQIEDGVSAYNQSVETDGLKDIHPDQFLFGKTSDNSDHKLYLTDIDLFFR